MVGNDISLSSGSLDMATMFLKPPSLMVPRGAIDHYDLHRSTWLDAVPTSKFAFFAASDLARATGLQSPSAREYATGGMPNFTPSISLKEEVVDVDSGKMRTRGVDLKQRRARPSSCFCIDC
eukprot:GEMP01087026.1.p1 GENE.GEMP01087026.1~~GEMP01087026.1.p1  ORF type:complete len:122 (+),score=29.40 GEMP01087026.1:114-479(+)